MIQQWLTEIKERIPIFLTRLKNSNKPGFYRYSLTGDCLDHTVHWGLGQAVFVAKILYMLNQLTEELSSELSSFITVFQNREGYIHDPIIERLSLSRRVYNMIRQGDFANLFNEQTKRAETRQAFAALRCLGHSPPLPFLRLPYTKKEITSFIHRLNWKYPWGAASHVSHLLFFLKNNRDLFQVHEAETEELIDHAFREVNFYRREDGSWHSHKAKIPLHQKINGAMKMMTGYEAAARDDFENAEGLIDLCLSAVHDRHACDHFNIVCVLYYCSRKISYRKPEIELFFSDRLKQYRKHYWPEEGGFSFHQGRANDIYYEAKITRGLPEPDIHGTILFLWGISLIADFLKVKDSLGFRIPIT